MTREPTKPIKRLLRECAGEAYEEELRRALAPLAADFERWSRGELASGELCELIHRFHQGPARKLFAKYSTGYNDMVVAYAIANGVIDGKKVAAELLEYLDSMIAMCQEANEQEPPPEVAPNSQ